MIVGFVQLAQHLWLLIIMRLSFARGRIGAKVTPLIARNYLEQRLLLSIFSQPLSYAVSDQSLEFRAYTRCC